MQSYKQLLMLLLYLLQVDPLTSKVNQLVKTVDNINKKVTVNPWIPLCAAALGGVVVWIGQYLDRKAKRKQEWKKEINDLFTRCEMLLFLIKNNLKDYSTQRNLRMFWYHSHLIELTKKKPNAELVKRYYDNCTSCADNAIKSHLRIGETISEYYSNLSKFKVLTDCNINTTAVENLVINTDLADAREIELSLDSKQALEVYTRNKRDLYKQYLDIYNCLDLINREIYTVCQSIFKKERNG